MTSIGGRILLACLVTALASALSACSSVRSQVDFANRKDLIRRAIAGETSEKVVTGRLHGTGQTPATVVIAVAGTKTVRCLPAPAGCATYINTRQLFQSPVAVDGGIGPTVVSGTIVAVWEAYPGRLTRVSMSSVERVQDSAQLTGDRLWSLSQGDTVSVFGLIENHEGGGEMRGEVELIIGDLDVFVRGI